MKLLVVYVFQILLLVKRDTFETAFFGRSPRAPAMIILWSNFPEYGECVIFRHVVLQSSSFHSVVLAGFHRDHFSI
jgi:hypothetical protein